MGIREFISRSFDFNKSVKGYTGFLRTGGMKGNVQLIDARTNALTVLDISLYAGRAIDKRAEKVSEIEFTLKDAKGKTVENNELIDKLYKPNDFFTGAEFWKLYQTYYDLVGEVYIYVEKESEVSIGSKKQAKIKGLHLLIPTSVKWELGEDGMPIAYKYKTANSEITYETADIIYIHNPDPVKPLRGQSILRAGYTTINTEQQINTYHANILANGGKVEGVFKFSDTLTQQQAEQLRDQYEKQYASAKKAGKPLFLGGNAEYTRIGLSPDELSFLEAKRVTLEDICIMTSVPKSMLASTNDVKFDNADADRSIFLRETINPLLKKLVTALDERLFPNDLFLGYVDPTPSNVDQNIKKAESGVKSYYLTINEARKINGYEPIENGDTLFMPANLATMQDVLDGTAFDTTKTQAKKIKSVGEEIEHPLRDFETRRNYWELQIKRMDRREKKFVSTLNKYFTDQEKRILEKLSKYKTNKKNAFLNELFDMTLEIKIGKDMFFPVLRELLEKTGQEAQDTIGSDRDFLVSADMVSWIESRTDIFLQQINETTIKELAKQFEENLAEGAGRIDLVNRIEQTYGNISKSRAKTIARTEVHNVTQYSTIQGYKQAGMPIKIWVAVMDGKTRESHAVEDGEERPIDTPFSNGLMYPGDPRGSADEVINCRCVI